MTWRAPNADDRFLALAWGVGAAGSLVLAPLAPVFARFLPGCTFHALTGLPCPTCGATRAALALAHGRLLEALSVNPLAALAGAGFLGGGVVAASWVLAGGKIPVAAWPVPRRWPWLVLAALAANWAYLIAARV